MKNSWNLGFIALLLVVLGCSCPNLKDLKSGGTSSPTPYSTPFVSNTPTTTPTTKSSSITLAKYNQLKNEIKYSDAVAILGEEGSQVSNSQSGSYKIVTYKWEGDNYSYIILTFTNDRLKFKSQASLK